MYWGLSQSNRHLWVLPREVVEHTKDCMELGILRGELERARKHGGHLLLEPRRSTPHDRRRPRRGSPHLGCRLASFEWNVRVGFEPELEMLECCSSELETHGR